MKGFILVLLSLSAYSGSVVGLRCYVCSSTNSYQECGAFVDSSTPIQSDCSMCGFGTSLVGTGPYAKTVYVRQCTKVGGVSGLDGISSCHSSDVSGIKMNVCICTSDLCNASEAKTLASGPGQTSSGTGKFLGANEVAAKVSVKLFIAMLSTIVFAF